MKRTLPLLALLLTATLTGCNDSNDPPPEPKVQQRGYGEVELYEAARHPDGHIIQPGETAVLALEAMNGADNPDPGNTGSVGIDEVTFDIKDAGPLTLTLTEADLAVIAKVELWTLTGGLLAQADRQTPSRTLRLTAGRYLLRVHAGHSNAKPVSLFVYPTVATQSQTNAHRLANPNQVQQLLQTNNCPNCNLSWANLSNAELSDADLTGANLTNTILAWANLTGANLTGAILSHAEMTGANLTEANLTGANLTEAILTNANLSEAILINANLTETFLTNAILTQANLTGAILTTAFLTDANLAGANLTGANLTNTNLTDANLTGANLTDANLGPDKNLPGANLSGADLSGATWTDGKTICAPGSIGQCN